MAQYKVIQDIEAEDKLLGPLSLRQFIYAVIVVVLGFISFRLIVANAWFLAIPFLPPMLFFGLLAAPLGRHQSSEVWLLAKIRFFFKPRRRIWDQSGVQELVTITAPKKAEKVLTKQFGQDEVKSRLKTLASTLDTRGWAVKNAATNVYAYTNNDQGSDRLIDIPAMPVQVPENYVDPSEDVLDPIGNPRASRMDQLLQTSTQTHRQQVLEHMRQAAVQPPAQPATPVQQTPQYPTAPANTVAAPNPTKDEQALLQQLHQKDAQASLAYGNLHTIQPLAANTAPPAPPRTPQSYPQAVPAQTQQPQAQAVTTPPDPGILELVNNDDLDVATIARQVNKPKEDSSPDEVVISLH